LNAADAAAGEGRWSRDITAAAEVGVPMWGFSSSPLVVGNRVIVFAGGGEKTLRAYRADTGKPAWSAAAGKDSYSSAHLATVGGEPQLLFVSDSGLSAINPSSGAGLWEYSTPAGNPGVPRPAQPHAAPPPPPLSHPPPP